MEWRAGLLVTLTLLLSPAARAEPCTEGAACDDGNACTFPDICQAGACVGGPDVSCADALVCTGAEACEPAFGCVPEALCPVTDSPSFSCADGACPVPGEPGFGHDGSYRLALPKYTVTAETVVDATTGLTWQREVEAVWRSQTDASATCAALELDGQTDWRLPDVGELMGIIDHGRSPPFDPVAFPETLIPGLPWSPSGPVQTNGYSGSLYWTATTATPKGQHIWAVDFAGGGISYWYRNIITSSGQVQANTVRLYRCVRGPRASGNQLAVGAVSVKDRETGLEWQREFAPERLAWEPALAYCEDLDLAGRTDWRLPTRKELGTLVHYGRAKPAIDPAVFPGMDYPQVWSGYDFWTGTPAASTPGNAWMVHFGYGENFHYSTSVTFRVRCVRGACPASPCAAGACGWQGDGCGGSLWCGACACNGDGACDDGDACTVDACTEGTCQHSAVVCNDGDACTADACALGSGCGHGLIRCRDSSVCTADTCVAATGCASANDDTLACTDFNACTQGDACVSGKCVAGSGISCDDGSACTIDVCDKAAGCANTPLEGPCDDGDPCTAPDDCQAGACVGTPDGACNDVNKCTVDTCADGCTHTPLGDGAACNDGEACTTTDACTAGACEGAAACSTCAADADCGDADPCTADACLGGFCRSAPKAWEVALGGTSDKGRDVVALPDGGFAVGGTLYVWKDSNTYWHDWLITRVDGAGTVLWKRQIGSGRVTSSSFDGLAALADGTLVALGRRTLLGTTSCWLARFDVDGTTLWAKPIDATSCPNIATISGGVVVAGYNNKGQWLGAFDAMGTSLWSTKLGGQVSGWLYDVAETADGTLLVGTDQHLARVSAAGAILSEVKVLATGETLKFLAPLPGGGAALLTTKRVLRLTPELVPLWARTFGASPLGVVLTSDGAIVAARAEEARRFDAAGNTTWTRAYPAVDPLFGLAPAPRGGVVLAREKGPPWLQRLDPWGATACDPASPCNTLEPSDCNDGKACTTDGCDAATGCAHAAFAGVCEDGDLCTIGDVCQTDATCVGAVKPCSDGVACTADACSSGSGACVHTPLAEGAACDDAQPCTVDDVCASGACAGEAACATCADTADCDDGDACTAEACDGGLCVSGPVELELTTGVPEHDEVGALVRLPGGRVALAGARGPDAWLLRMEVDGTEIASETFGPGGWRSAVAKDGSGLVLAGWAPNPPLNAIDARVLRLDPQGQPMWNVIFGTAYDERAEAAAVTSDGGVVLAVSRKCVGVCNDLRAGLTRLDDTGATAWTVTWGTYGPTYQPRALAATADGGVVLAVDELDGSQPSRAHVVRFDALGKQAWSVTRYVPDLRFSARALSVLGTDVSVAGTRDSGWPSYDDLWAMRINGAGAVVWERYWRDATLVRGLAVAGTTDGGLLVAGESQTPGTLADGSLTRLDSGGRKLWQRTLGSDGADRLLAIVPYGEGFMAAGTQELAPSWMRDAWLVRVDAWGRAACDPASPCHGLDAADCADGTACTLNDCGPAGCVNGAVSCDDGDACTEELCDEAAGCTYPPISCDDGNPCTVDGCEASSQGGCFHDFSTVACTDGDVCTVGDKCASGACVPGPLDACDDGNACTDDGCQGGCTHVPGDADCDDGSACTTGESCQGGICVPAGGPSCDDDNNCTTDACNAATGCTHAPAAGSCSDGDPCTAGDACGGGACVPGGAANCDDENPCTADGCTPGQGCTHAPVAGPCDDDDACTSGDACQGGKCVSGAGPSCDDGDPCTADGCDPATGCTHLTVAAPCDDGDACTTGDVCQAGTCAPGSAKDCDDGKVCTTDGCTAATGCVHAPAPGPCDDGNECTAGDACQGGECVPGPGPTCDDGNPCTKDSCHVAAGCQHVDQPGPCDDGDPCTVDDGCVGGACTLAWPNACDDGNACTDDSCAAGTGCVHAPNALPCEDGNPCTAGDACAASECVSGSGPTCNDGNPCTDDGCSPATGCTHGPNAGGCDDGDACTAGDACQAGLCVPGEPDACDDGNPCTSDTCAGGCVHLPKPGPCDDGEACTAGDACAKGVCVPGAGPTCDDDNPCTEDSCEPATGCQHIAIAGACEDGDPCTAGDACAAGFCVPGGPNACGDANPCTDDACMPGLGCVNTPNALPCEDGNPCTAGDACVEGTCKSGSGPTCDDGNPCTKDGCSPATGCSHAAQSASCEDGDPCTAGDACQAGVCVPGAPDACDDGEPCTADACEPGVGCAHAPLDGPCEDGDPCTGGDACLEGACEPGVGPTCDDGDPCTDASCDPSVGCLFAAAAGACEDGDPCTAGDACQAGVCVPGGPNACDDGNACTDDACNAGCTHTSNVAACEDGNPCTAGDGCVAGACQSGSGPACDDANPCTLDTCDPASGCHHAAASGGCEDGDPCTGGDTCAAGMCLAGAFDACDDGNPCTDDPCDAASGCAHAANAAGCEDGNPCTSGDACQSGECVPGTGPSCDDANPCTKDTCDVATGCHHTPTSDACEDGDPCTAGDACQAGVCVPGAPNACDDGNPCTAGSCGASGCTQAPVAGPCDDGDTCTTDDHCDAGGCVATGGPTCDDGDPCTADTCDAGQECVYAAAPDGTPCDDGDPCNGGDACEGGACVFGATPPCDDGNPCTADACDDAGACAHVAQPACCVTDADCPPAAGACVALACAEPGKACVAQPKPGCCTTNTECDDQDPCTLDTCAGGLCENEPIAACCSNDLACDDGDPCTADRCTEAACVHESAACWEKAPESAESEPPTLPGPGCGCRNEAAEGPPVPWAGVLILALLWGLRWLRVPIACSGEAGDNAPAHASEDHHRQGSRAFGGGDGGDPDGGVHPGHPGEASTDGRGRRAGERHRG